MSNNQNSYMRLYQVLEFFPISRSKFYKGMKAGIYPKPLKHGRISLWKADDVYEMLNNLGGR